MQKVSRLHCSFIVLPLAILGLILATGTAALADFNESGGKVIIEAEDYHSITRNGARSSFYKFPPGSGPGPDPDGPHYSGASNGSYVEILPDTRVNHDDPLKEGVSFYKTPYNAPRMNYRVHINNGGRYYIRARGFSSGAEDNSIHFGYDGKWPTSGSPAQWCKRNQWNWTGNRRTKTEHCGVYNALYLDLTRGDHTIMVAMREDGVELDKFILTTDKTYFPSGTAGGQSSETAGGNNKAPNVNAGPNQTIGINDTATLNGSASDDGIPDDTLIYKWRKISGPGIADFVNESRLSTTVSFNQTGSYVLELSANDGALKSTDRIGITVVKATASDDNSNDNSNPDTGGQNTDANGAMVVEAESHNAKVSRGDRSWNAVTLSGTRGMKVTPDKGARVASNFVSNSPYMRFNVNFNATGTHYVWLRGYAFSNGNSVHVGMDGKESSTSTNITFAKKGSWTWTGNVNSGSRARINVTRTGSHTIEIYMREDGLALDKLLITKTSGYTPTGNVAGDGSSSGDTSTGKVFQQNSSNGLIVMQAENRNATIDRSGHGWVPVNQGGTPAMEAVPDSGARINSGYGSKSPYMQFNVNFVKTGAHYVWLRADCMGNDNTAHVGLNGSTPSTGQGITLETRSGWVWSGKTNGGQRATINVTKTGIQAVKIFMREDGMICDKVVLTTSSSYQPSGSGPAESVRK